MSFPFRFGPCWLDSVLAGGQSSLLFLARPGTEDATRTGRALVVKVPYLYLQRSSGFRQMFYERMHALVGLSATDLVTPEVSGRTSGLVWAASPYVEGWDADRALAAVQRGGSRPSPRQVLTLGVRLAEALAELHEAPSENGAIVHGEIRPGKLLFERDGQPRLLLASAITAASGERSSSSSAERFAWRAPEQLLRQPETARTDVRGLALLLFVLVTGSNPFQRRTTARTCSAILQDQVLFEGDAQLSGGLSALLRAAMSSDPERRPASMRALASALRGELEKLGGEEPWAPWLDALRARGDAAPEPASNPERDALIARLLRDAPRTAEPPPEPHHHAPAAARAPVPPEPRPAPSRPPPAREQELEPTELLPTTHPAPKVPASRPSSEVSGFTLVPDDAGSEAAVPGAVNLNDLLRHQLPPEAPETPDPTEATEEYTEEYTEATEEVEDEPTNPGIASHFQADAPVDSSFVLVTDELPADAGLMLAPEAAGSKETIPEGLRYTPLVQDEEEGLLPAMSAEEGMAELERERAARGEDVERDDEETEELPTPMDEELPQSATIRVGPPWDEGPALVSASPPRAPEPAPVRPALADPSPEPVTTLPDHAVSQPERTLPPPEPAQPPRPVATAPVLSPPAQDRVVPTPTRPTPPRPETPKPPRTEVAPPPPVSDQRVIKPPPVEMRPKPPWDTSKPGGGAGKYAAIGLVVLLGLAGALYASGALKPEPVKPPPPEKVATTSTAPVTDGSSAAPTPTTEQTAQPTTEQTTQPTTEQTTEQTAQPTTEQTTGQATADATTAAPETPPAQSTPRTPKPLPVSEGPPGLTALKSDATDTRVTLRGTMRGSFARPTMTVQPGGGTNGFDLYVLSFRGIESQMKLTRVNVTSAFVSGVQIVSSKDLLELRVSVASGSNVSYSKVSDGFSITVNQPRTGG